jgi:hypothetical protein
MPIFLLVKYQKILIFFGTQDDQVLYSYTNIHQEMTFTSSWFKETNLNVLYTSNVYVIFIEKIAHKSKGIISVSKHFYTCKLLDLLWKKNRFFWLIFSLLFFLAHIGCTCNRESKVQVTAIASVIFFGMQLHRSYLVTNLRCLANKRPPACSVSSR